jgi:hypothetical protein
VAKGFPGQHPPKAETNDSRADRPRRGQYCATVRGAVPAGLALRHRLTGRGTGLTLGGSVPTARLWHKLAKVKDLCRRTPRGQVSTPYTALFTAP